MIKMDYKNNKVRHVPTICQLYHVRSPRQQIKEAEFM